MSRECGKGGVVVVSCGGGYSLAREQRVWLELQLKYWQCVQGDFLARRKRWYGFVHYRGPDIFCLGSDY